MSEAQSGHPGQQWGVESLAGKSIAEQRNFQWRSGLRSLLQDAFSSFCNTSPKLKLLAPMIIIIYSLAGSEYRAHCNILLEVALPLPLIPRKFCRTGFLALVFLMIPSGAAGQSTARVLEAKWEFRADSNTDQADVKEWHRAQVLGVVQTDLLRDGLIPDPFYQDNDTRLQWIGLAEWEYRTSFQANAATISHEHIDLVFEGLDTYADVYVNDKAVLHCDNMFRRWRVSVKTLLKAGPNTLRVVFHSPIESMIPKVKALPYILPSVTSHNTGNEENIATAPYTRKAAYQYGWDWGPRYVTEGIWQPIRLRTWAPLRIENFHIQKQRVSQEAATLTAELEIEASRSTAGSAESDHCRLSRHAMS